MNKTETEMLDPEIADLVLAMNESGRIETIGSCQGHPRKFCDPYVYFHTDSNTASQVEMALRKLGRGPNSRLFLKWEIVGHFNIEGKLHFRLQSPRYQDGATSAVGAFIQHFTTRRQIRHDLKEIAIIFRQAFSVRRGGLAQ